jgi:hypothetical protein
LRAELGRHVLVGLIWHVCTGQQRHRLGEGQRGALAGGEVRGLRPGGQPTRAAGHGLARQGLGSYRAEGVADDRAGLVIGYGRPAGHVYTTALARLCAVLDPPGHGPSGGGGSSDGAARNGVTAAGRSAEAEMS